MSEKADTVPGLGFKDKEKAFETIKNLEGRDPDYQKLAIKGLIGRAKRTLTCKFCYFPLFTFFFSVFSQLKKILHLVLCYFKI